MNNRRFLGALAAATASIALALTGAVSTGSAAATAAGGPASAANLSTPASISAFLASKGVDLTTVVWQTGLNNYAGPKCPGPTWNCTTSANVVQIAQAGGQNKFQCDPAFFEGDGDPPFPLPEDVFTEPTLGVCVIVQINETGGGQNHARCFERSTSTPTAHLRCLVYQENEAGHNHLQVHQQVRQSGGDEQVADVDVDVTQRNTAGNNNAHVHQQVDQSTSDVDDVTLVQRQDSTFDIEPLDQVTQTGNNLIHLRQSLHQDGTATGSNAISQYQSNEQDGDVDQFAGAFDFALVQSASGGGASHVFAHQIEHQQLRGPGLQEQTGPQGCCGASTQFGDPARTFMNIHQQSTQSAEGGAAYLQNQNLVGECASNGTCTITHHARNNTESAQESFTQPGPFFYTTSCSSFAGEGEGGFCSDPNT